MVGIECLGVSAIVVFTYQPKPPARWLSMVAFHVGNVVVLSFDDTGNLSQPIGVYGPGTGVVVAFKIPPPVPVPLIPSVNTVLTILKRIDDDVELIAYKIPGLIHPSGKRWSFAFELSNELFEELTPGRYDWSVSLFRASDDEIVLLSSGDFVGDFAE